MSEEVLLGTEVPVGQIDRELKKLWEADDTRSAASLMNLVIYSETPGSLVQNTEAARELTEEQACRAILVEIDRSITEPSVRSFITAHCNLFGGKKSVCSEQVAFKMTGTVSGRLRNTVFAHLNSDLPLILWWQGEFTSVLTERLLSVVDRLLIDSSEFEDPSSAHQTLAELSAATQSSFVLQDIAWTRTYMIRLAIAQIFDRPLVEAAVGEISKVSITTQSAHKVSGLLLASWMATQAGWELQSLSDECASFVKKGRTIEIAFSTDDSSAPISEVMIEAGSVNVILSRAKGDRFVKQCISAPGASFEQLSPADEDTPSGLIGSQLSRGGKNRLYLKTLPVFRKLLEVK